MLRQIQIPYSFAKRHGVLLKYDGDHAQIIRCQDTSLEALQEARRYLGQSVPHSLGILANHNKLQQDWKIILICSVLPIKCLKQRT